LSAQPPTLIAQFVQRCRRGLRVGDDVVIIEPLAECGVRSDFGVSDTEVGIGGIVSQPVLARAALNLGNALAAEPLICQQSQWRRAPVRTLQDRGERHAVFYRLVRALPE